MDYIHDSASAHAEACEPLSALIRTGLVAHDGGLRLVGEAGGDFAGLGEEDAGRVVVVVRDAVVISYAPVRTFHFQ